MRIALNEEEIYYIPVEGMITERLSLRKIGRLLHKVSESTQRIFMKSNTDDVKDQEMRCSDVNTIVSEIC